ncbi:MAG: beta-propeller domain-containing protein [Candidatus Magasanikbacteria bacterium]|nr:beta-propeller domain-containing protein [Candidatus Magasanikbacteria bacterium]
MFQKDISIKTGFLILSIITTVCIAVSIILVYTTKIRPIKVTDNNINGIAEQIDNDSKVSEVIKKAEIKKFSSAEEFKQYLSKQEENQGYYGGMSFGASSRGSRPTASMDMGSSESIGLSTKGSVSFDGGQSAERVSETNVQVTGIDEPDIVKTDGKEIYFSKDKIMSRDLTYETGFKYTSFKGGTFLVNAFPIDKLKNDSKINKNGDLLLAGNILIIFSYENPEQWNWGGYDLITAYDVSDKANPKEKWQAKLSENESLTDVRLLNGKIYLATNSSVNRNSPCPIKPLIVGVEEISISCSDIYYPTVSDSADSVFNFMVLDTVTGKVENKTSFVGSSGQSVFYMSDKAMYLTYKMPVDYFEMAYNFVIENRDLAPDWVIEKLEKIRVYDLSQTTKSVELSQIVGKFMMSLDKDEQLKFENEIGNRAEKYYIKNRREFDKTGIIKIGLKDFSVINGVVAGHPLNQFSMDEYKGNLRIATTIGDRSFAGFSNNANTVSDVYVLDENLKTLGSVKDLGETERIYSVRFMGDRGYVVTFREIDPFYVLNLADPKNPVLRGELKIPGYSSYLHPLGENKVLGIGREDNKIKISIFDASVSENPIEVSKYILNEYWSESLNNHRAFLLDDKHKIFFIPASKGGYIFGYDNNSLVLKKAVSETEVKRAIYLDDYLYIISDEKIAVFNEITWEKVKEIEFTKESL